MRQEVGGRGESAADDMMVCIPEAGAGAGAAVRVFWEASAAGHARGGLEVWRSGGLDVWTDGSETLTRIALYPPTYPRSRISFQQLRISRRHGRVGV